MIRTDLVLLEASLGAWLGMDIRRLGRPDWEWAVGSGFSA
jgi:hypothetical protein